MRMYDLIEKKKTGLALSDDELHFWISRYVSGDIPDYQTAAMLMAICFKGMDDREMTTLTMEMAHSGDMIDLSPIKGIKVDKHSTGGVGDKTTLVVGPLVASCGVKVAKMSGRGLGHTGGTIDKLESIPGFKTSIANEEFFSIVNKTGIAVVGQSGNLVPADKKLYSLRDVTATVDSIPLIASSIMSKKIAAGSDGIVLDVKTGSGAFMKTLDDSIILAEKMVAIGKGAGRRCCALITDMNQPLGLGIGNALEVKEAIEVLSGGGPEDLREVCTNLAANMLWMAGKGNIDECLVIAKTVLHNGSAINTLVEMVKAQGGDSSYILDVSKFGISKYKYQVKSQKDGYVSAMDAEKIGIASVELGAGREKKEDKIDYLAGIILNKKYGDRVEVGDILATLYADDEKLIKIAETTLKSAYDISNVVPKKRPLIFARITEQKTERYD